MFWNKRKKLPVTDADREWIDSDLKWLREEISEAHFMEILTVTPTKNFYNRTFDGTEKDAEYILERTMKLMSIDSEKANIKLEFFSDQPIEMDDGTTLSSPADINGKWNSAAGTYQEMDCETIITIETNQLNNPISLIATIAHELSHYILLGEKRIEENDEYLTDFMAITYGFGVFLGNSRFSFSKFSNSGMSGWQSSSQGYLPEQVIAYTMASLSIQRNEKTDYSQFLNKSMKKYFDKSIAFLKEEKSKN